MSVSIDSQQTKILLSSYRVLRQLTSNVLMLLKRLPLPTSFLLDREGRLKVIYKGPVSVDDLLADVRRSPTTDAESLEWVAFLPGRSLGLDPIVKREAKTLFNLAGVFETQGRLEDAADFYRVVVERVSDSAISHFKLGSVLMRQQELDEAIVRYRQAIALKPDYLEAHLSLGAALEKTFELQQATEHYRSALAIDANLAPVRQRLNEIEAKLNLRE